MQNLLVHFSQQRQPDQPLRPGVQRIVRQANGSGGFFFVGGQPARLRRVQNLLVHFSQQRQPDQPLRPGVQRIVRQANGS
ncbi:hypothetical protein C7E25_24015, partial [Stenotrophomonas maltophilia]